MHVAWSEERSVQHEIIICAAFVLKTKSFASLHYEGFEIILHHCMVLKGEDRYIKDAIYGTNRLQCPIHMKISFRNWSSYMIVVSGAIRTLQFTHESHVCTNSSSSPHSNVLQWQQITYPPRTGYWLPLMTSAKARNSIETDESNSQSIPCIGGSL